MSRSAELLKQRILSTYGENRQLDRVPMDHPHVSCTNGTFVGLFREGVDIYRGIPFACPPTGTLRWKRPLPVPESNEIYEAFYNGKSPIQTEWATEAASYYPQSEDCLYLNIWTSREVSEKKAVMVFFHGGSYGWGGTADPLYDGYNFVKAHPDIVLVTVGYRTGLFGFVDFSMVPGGEEYPDAPNLGILDQIESLRWVRNNIASFGGDKDQVTIFGESAGGGSVSLLPIIEEAKGLFHRVIAQSGSVALTFSKAQCQSFTKRLLKACRCGDMASLAALDTEKLKAVNENLNYYNNFPQRDGRLIPLDPYQAYLDGRSAGVDLLTGTNQNESNYWVRELGGIVPYAIGAPVKFENDLRALEPSDRDRVRRFMKGARRKYGHKVWCRAEFYNELMFRLPAVRQCEAHVKNGGKAYMYYWTEPSTNAHMGACHAVELAYVFGNLDETIYTGKRGDEELSRRVGDMWADFAKTGDPGLPDLPWPVYDTADRATMRLNKQIELDYDILKEQREELSPLLSYWINPSYAEMDYNVPFVRRHILSLILVILGIAALIILKAVFS